MWVISLSKELSLWKKKNETYQSRPVNSTSCFQTGRNVNNCGCVLNRFGEIHSAAKLTVQLVSPCWKLVAPWRGNPHGWMSGREPKDHFPWSPWPIRWHPIQRCFTSSREIHRALESSPVTLHYWLAWRQDRLPARASKQEVGHKRHTASLVSPLIKNSPRHGNSFSCPPVSGMGLFHGSHPRGESAVYVIILICRARRSSVFFCVCHSGV